MSPILQLSDYELRQLDYLVDGTLSEPHYTRLLRRLDETENGWKQCALAFLEEQAMKQELNGMTRDSVTAQHENLSSRLATSPAPVRLSFLSNANDLMSEPAASDTSTALLRKDSALNTTGTRHKTKSWIMTLIPLAMSTFLAFGIGWQSSHNFAPQPNLESDEKIADLSAVMENNNDIDLASSNPAPKAVVLTEQEAADLIRAASFANHDSDLANTFPENTFERQTFRLNPHVEGQLERHQTMMPVTSDDGISRVVPVEHMRFRPIAIHGF